MFFKKDQKNRGFSLLELVLAVAIFSLASYGMATLLIDSNISTRFDTERIAALSYAKEGVEASRSIRDIEWSNLIDGTYGLTASTSGQWEFSDTPESLEDKYTRTVTVSPFSDSIKNISVAISWPLTTDRISTTTLNTILTNWQYVAPEAGGGCDSTCLALRVGLFAYLPLDTNTNDYSDIGINNGTAGAGATPEVVGAVGGAYTFDGSSNIAFSSTIIPYNDDSYTISMWTKTAGDAFGYLFVQPGGDGWFQNHGILYNTGGVVQTQEYFGTHYYAAGTVNFYDDEWHNLIVVRSDASTIAIYFDGSPVSLAGTMGAYTSTPPDRASLGADTPGSSYTYGYTGSIDEFTVWDRVLNETEVGQIYNGGAGRSLINE